MSNLRTHYEIALGTGSVCGRGKRVTDRVYGVDCMNCRAQSVWEDARTAYIEAQEAAFQAQTPRTIVPQFGRVNEDGVMECFKCQGVLFRERPRSLFSYHYVCEGCGQSLHPMTETGMCT